jgi:predicted DNA-binding transcriptional regulator AlpA
MPDTPAGHVGLTAEDVARLPAAVDVPTAARALGIGRTTGYALARAGDFPCRVIRVGRSLRVPTADLRRALGLDAGPPEDSVVETVAPMQEGLSSHHGGPARPG